MAKQTCRPVGKNKDEEEQDRAHEDKDLEVEEKVQVAAAGLLWKMGTDYSRGQDWRLFVPNSPLPMIPEAEVKIRRSPQCSVLVSEQRGFCFLDCEFLYPAEFLRHIELMSFFGSRVREKSVQGPGGYPRG